MTDPKEPSGQCQGCHVVTLHRFRDLTLCTDCERELQKMMVREVFSIGPGDMFRPPTSNAGSDVAS